MRFAFSDGIAVDAECNLDNAHVYNINGEIYMASMTLVDIVMDKNSYCRMQVIEADNRERYWVFKKHGRISTNIGSSSLDEFSSARYARRFFRGEYKKLTGNEFGEQIFEKKPDKFQIMDIVFDKPEKVLSNLVESELNPYVLDVMKLICDQKAMKNMMLEFQLDTDLMPLGRLSGSQIEKARKILRELSVLLKTNAPKERFIEASNRFYTMIPHKFINDRPTIINTLDMVMIKYEMIERLQEIKFTYGLLNDIDDKKNPLDSLHSKLNTVITPLNKNSIEYKQIENYTKQTHDESYDKFDIELEDIFIIARDGEDNRFKPYEKFENKKLLWHGSSLTNFVSILTIGLKINPTNVFISGKTFGNGIYFADTIGKSVSFCRRKHGQSALLLLSEVALGDMLEVKKHDRQIENNLNGKHSVKGVGNIQTPFEIQRPSGVKIPKGKPKKMSNINSRLKLNEFVVYDEAQVKMRYLVKVKLKKYNEDESADRGNDAEVMDYPNSGPIIDDSDIETIDLTN